MEIQLNCHNPKCDKALIVEVNRKPDFGFELAGIAKDVGWTSVIDTGQHSTFIFCSEECARKGKFSKGAMLFSPTK